MTRYVTHYTPGQPIAAWVIYDVQNRRFLSSGWPRFFRIGVPSIKDAAVFMKREAAEAALPRGAQWVVRRASTRMVAYGMGEVIFDRDSLSLVRRAAPPQDE